MAEQTSSSAPKDNMAWAVKLVKKHTPSGFVLVRAGAARAICLGKQLFYMDERYVEANLQKHQVSAVDPRLDMTGRELQRVKDGEIPTEK